MLDLFSFRVELTSIVNNLAKSVVTESISAAEKSSLNKQENEGELGAVVHSLCTDAINDIVKIVESITTNQADIIPESRRQHIIPTGAEQETKADLKPSQSAVDELTNNTGQSKLETKTYILIYGSAVIDDDCPENPHLLENCDNGKLTLTVEEEGCKSPQSQDSPSPLTPAESHDHDYILPSSAASITATTKQVVSTEPLNKKQPCLRTKKKALQTAAKNSVETHECQRCRMLFPCTQQLQDHLKRAHLDCALCGLEFSGILKLREHEVKVHQLMPYSCDYCGKTFSHKAHHNLHVMTHTGEKKCHCDICGKGYSCISTLKTHRMTHFAKTFVCDICGKSFYHACHLNRHKHTHKEVRPYHCDVCGKGFTQAENLKSHKMTHTDEKQLCAICGKSYRCLRNHMINRHAHEIPTKEMRLNKCVVVCEVCGKKFPNPSQYKLHKMSHTGEKPYHCDICGKSFRMKETLRDHKYTHTGEKPYKCTVCGKSFHSAACYMRHRSIHTGEMPYSCKECGKQFRLLTFLKAHQKTRGHLRQKMREEADCTDDGLSHVDSDSHAWPL